MDAQATELLGKVINPCTGASIADEDRIESVTFKGDELVVKYKRDGIPNKEKQEMEGAMLESLSQVCSVDDIYILSSSTEKKLTGEQTEQKEQSEPKAAPHSHAGSLPAKKKLEQVDHIIAVASGKGGVGKSTFTTNLAVTLKNAGYKVGVLDADVYGPSIPMLFGKRTEKPKVNDEQKILPLESNGVQFISFGLFVEEHDPVIWRGPMLGGVLKQFLFDVSWGKLDFLIIDLPPGTGDMQLSLAQTLELDGAVVISTPQDVALLDATKGLNMFKKINVNILGMVENMSTFVCSSCGNEHDIFGSGGVEKACEKLETNYLGSIPLELELRLSADEGKPYMANEKFQDRSVYKSYVQVANKLVKEVGAKEKKGTISKIFNKLMN